MELKFIMGNRALAGKFDNDTSILYHVLVMCQEYASKHDRVQDGRFHIGRDRLMDYANLKRRSLDSAMKKLINDRYVSVKRIGTPARNWYAIDDEIFAEIHGSPYPHRIGQSVQNEQSSLYKTYNLASTNRTISSLLYEEYSMNNKPCRAPTQIEPPKTTKSFPTIGDGMKNIQESDEALAKFWMTHLTETYPTDKATTWTLERFAGSFAKLRMKFEVTPEELQAMFSFAIDDEFFMQNIRSPENLIRKKWKNGVFAFNALRSQASSTRKPKAGSGPADFSDKPGADSFKDMPF